MTDEERAAQRISFAYGNLKMHDPTVTREGIEVAARHDPLAPDELTDEEAAALFAALQDGTAKPKLKPRLCGEGEAS